MKRAKISSVDLINMNKYKTKTKTKPSSPGGIPHEFGGIADGIENHIEGVPQTNAVRFIISFVESNNIEIIDPE